eukprot:852234-Pyramimonas_sp.AAC.1
MDVIVAQETHGQEGDLETLTRDFPRFRAFGSFIQEAHAGGAVLLVREELAEQFAMIGSHALLAGRILTITLQGPKGALQVTSVHLDPEWSERATRGIIHSLSRSLLPQFQAMSILLGGFNSMNMEHADTILNHLFLRHRHHV